MRWSWSVQTRQGRSVQTRQGWSVQNTLEWVCGVETRWDLLSSQLNLRRKMPSRKRSDDEGRHKEIGQEVGEKRHSGLHEVHNLSSLIVGRQGQPHEGQEHPNLRAGRSVLGDIVLQSKSCVHNLDSHFNRHQGHKDSLMNVTRIQTCINNITIVRSMQTCMCHL